MLKKKLTDIVFDWCVEFLIYWAKILGISYNEINVYLFCIIWPIFTILLIAIILYQWRIISKLKSKKN
ncbi:MAG TPA: hypothetical protein PK079_07420 [Leptospiraceae bacterium]|nr:hypothetical protein [Leptospiraceae bacterium]HMW05795.1 hypothetical protein [Leptospiraceae bacterium]HMX32616.1 hypothetical protein [Leptospiraceae bacterium]HMY33330.1 hypothetical protein [Leptospiraceae bacterium]HMZ66204.1 hypothetical protein [Leptospiraceae bacterium]